MKNYFIINVAVLINDKNEKKFHLLKKKSQNSHFFLIFAVVYG